MTGVVNLSTYELTKARIRLCDDVTVVPLVRGDVVIYQLRSDSQGRFFQIGQPEYIFCSLLDGTRSIAQAVTLTARQLKSAAFSEQEATSIFRWLIDNGLAVPVNETGRHLSRANVKKMMQWSWNPFWTKLPLLQPDRLLKQLLPSFGWLFSPLMLLLSCVLFIWAGVVLSSHWDAFTSSAQQLFSPTNWLWLGVAWFLLKVVHEFAHGLACKYYGGEVREMGIIMILFAPMAYVDVTSSWGFSLRWSRMHVAVAGMFVELIIAALAILLWAATDSLVVQHLLYNVIVMASLSTLLFNANPLMRFDGYYVLSDLLGIPNMYTEASTSLKGKVERLCYGETRVSVSQVGWRRTFLLVYGVACFFWKTLITVSLMITASVLFEGAGIVLAVVGVGLWFGMPVYKSFQNWGKRFYYKPAQAIRAALIFGLTTAVFMAMMFLMPCPGSSQAPGIIEYADLSIIRANASGFVKKVHVHAGQTVKRGELLIELENDSLSVEVAELEASIQQSEAKQRASRNSGEIALMQIEVRNEQALQERLEEKQKQLAGLHVRAIADGCVIGSQLQHLRGKYIKEGAEILGIGREHEKELQVSIGQEVLDIAKETLQQPRTFRLTGSGKLIGEVTQISTRASLIPAHPALCAPYGGDLSVVEKQNVDSESDESERFELSEPRFLVTLKLSREVSGRTYAGQRGAMHLGFGSLSIAEVGYRAFSKWLRNRLNTAEQMQQASSYYEDASAREFWR